jgi:hypothetical protein
MFITLLLTTLLVSAAVSVAVAWAFNRPMTTIMHRIVAGDLAYAWIRYLRFALIVVGIGGGVQVWTLEKYIARRSLDLEHWTLELYNTLIGALQSTAIVLLVFFVFALIAVVIVQLFGARGSRPEATARAALNP